MHDLIREIGWKGLRKSTRCNSTNVNSKYDDLVGNTCNSGGGWFLPIGGPLLASGHLPQSMGHGLILGLYSITHSSTEIILDILKDPCFQ